MIDYLKRLGITAIELLPLQSFFTEPRLTQLGLKNYWGYNPINYFCLHADYGLKSELIDTVQALHKAGVEVILDVVYNHTAESDELGPTLSFRGIDNKSYYLLQSDQRFYVNHTGTGNVLNMNQIAVLDLTLASLRYWVNEIGIDGFRFDLATTLARVGHGFDVESPFLKAIEADPQLSQCKLIAEPWDIGPNGYVPGQFPAGWASWNDKFRDDVRHFWRGDADAHKGLAGRLLGSADIYDHSGKQAYSSVNFITAHDGFTLRDVVSYRDKHNHANGENNRDGHAHNISDNFGVEGPSTDPVINAARRQRQKNMMATLILSQGTPMILAGDEIGHSQMGNNNSYCQDNEITWLNWDNRDPELEEFTKALIKLRQSFPHFSQGDFLHGEPVKNAGLSTRIFRNAIWLSPSGQELAGEMWDDPSLTCFGLVLNMKDQGAILLIFNRGATQKFEPILEPGWSLKLSSAPTANDGMIPKDSIAVYHNADLYQTHDEVQSELIERAKAYHILDHYRDISGTVHETRSDTRDALLAAVESIPAQDYPEIVSKPPVYGASLLREYGGIWGVTCALYGLKSDRNWGMGDLEDLARLAEFLAEKGADYVGLNPVHALFPSASHLYAPYSPSSREFLNVMHIAPDRIPELMDSSVQLKKPDSHGDIIDYDLVYAAKSIAFEQAFERFEKLEQGHRRRKAFNRFCKSRGKSLEEHALFDSLFEQLAEANKTYDGYRNFPPQFQNPNSAECQKFARDYANRIEFYKYLQWVAHEQLAAAQERAVKAGMRIGLYLDFAVGIVPGGSDGWRYPTSYAQTVSLGAPGDQANPDGQMWNLLPFNPHALIVDNFEPFRQAMSYNMSVSGAIRFDHVLGLSRSFWIPLKGGAGAYMRYPFDALLFQISALSQDYQCVVFGEDLGTVPDDFRQKMAEWDLMGCSIYVIERTSSGDLIARDSLRRSALTAFSNHDFPTLCGFWNGDDFIWREKLGIGNHPDQIAHERAIRAHDKTILAEAAGIARKAETLEPKDMAALQAWLAGSPSLAFAVQLDDIMMENEHATIPGTT